MKVGIKLYNPDGEYLKKIIDHVDFIELTAQQGKDYGFLSNYNIPLTLHNEHWAFGVNPANPELRERNLKSVMFSLDLADRLNARFIVIHPGFIERSSCSRETTINFLKELDNRFLVENMPGTLPLEMKSKPVGADFEDMKEILQVTGKKFCLDFAHAAAAACTLGVDNVGFIRNMLGLKPVYFHISDSPIKSKTDEHLHLGKGNMDLNAFKRMIPSDSWVVIETQAEFEEQAKDIRFMREA